MIFKTNSEGQRIAVVSGNPLGSYLTGFLQGKATGSCSASDSEAMKKIHEELDFFLQEKDEALLEQLAGYDIIGKIRYATMYKYPIIDAIKNKGVTVDSNGVVVDMYYPFSSLYELIDQIEQGKETVTGPSGTIAISTKTNRHNAAVNAVITDSVRNITVTVE